MEVSTDLLESARKGQRQAIVDVLAMFYPAVHRIAHGISGREDVGKGVVRWVMRTSVSQIESWRTEDQPQRWFFHHTILTLRRASKHKPELSGDPLIKYAETSDAYYPAFIRALRSLAHQQQEAFILHHGERFNPRYMAVAMDCSMEAANTHLREATNSLSALAGDMFASFTAQLAHAYGKLTPDQNLVLDKVKIRVRRFLFPKRLFKMVSNLFTLAMLAAIVWFALKIWPMLRW